MPPEMSLEDMGVSFLDCVVDQICSTEPDIDKDGTTYVKVENYRTWMIADNNYLNLRDKLAVDGVQERAIDVYEKRKLWLTNGFILGLAIYGYFAIGINARLAQVLEKRKADGNQFSRGLANELVAALDFYDTKKAVVKGTGKEFSINDLQIHMDNVIERVSKSPDDVNRILKDLLIDEKKNGGNDLGIPTRISQT